MTLCDVLARHGVEVLRPDPLTAAQKAAGGKAGWANAFVRDPWFTVGGTVIEGRLRFPHRRLEMLPSRGLMQHEVLPSNATFVMVPAPEFLEGGDVVVLGKHVFVGHSGRASSPGGARFLAGLLEPQGYTVEAVRLAPTVLHLDCALGLVREGLMTVCPSLFLDGVPRRLEGWERIEVSEDEAARLATNGLPVSPSLYITDPAFARIAEAIARHGIAVETIDFAISRAFGGAFRCSTQALLRE
jgi:N-dimethylarginine dimethylaminohydrolase